jgi:hypothetical protein
MNKKKILFLFFFIFFINKSDGNELVNKVIVSIDNSIITEFDVNKEINLIKFVNKIENTNNLEALKKETINNLIDRKIKDIETNNYKIEVSEKELENNLYNYLSNLKISSEDIEIFFKKNEIEANYVKTLIKIDMKWSKLIREMYSSRINVNLTEIDKLMQKENTNSDNYEKLKQQLIINEQNKLLNKFSSTHLEKSKKKYLIKFL